MTIYFKSGDLLKDPSEALVNTVNCVGVMGKGVALQFKRRWPENYEQYRKVCHEKSLRPGRMNVFKIDRLIGGEEPKYIVNFPTKDHWKAKSKLEYIEDGLDALADVILKYQIKSIALPPLGCGNGGLDWGIVRPLIQRKLGKFNNIDINIYGPMPDEGEPEYAENHFKMTESRSLLIKTLADLEQIFLDGIDRLSLQKIAYLLQGMGVVLNVDYTRNLYGPYSIGMKKAFVSLNKKRIISGLNSSIKQVTVTKNGFAKADEFIALNRIDDSVIKKLNVLIEGLDSPYGLELLTTTHWLYHHKKITEIEKIFNENLKMGKNKRNVFTQEEIELAYKRLREDGLI